MTTNTKACILAVILTTKEAKVGGYHTGNVNSGVVCPLDMGLTMDVIKFGDKLIATYESANVDNLEDTKTAISVDNSRIEVIMADSQDGLEDFIAVCNVNHAFSIELRPEELVKVYSGLQPEGAIKRIKSGGLIGYVCTRRSATCSNTRFLCTFSSGVKEEVTLAMKGFKDWESRVHYIAGKHEQHVLRAESLKEL